MEHRYRHDPSKNLVGFVVGDVHYAVPIARVKEISNPMTLVALPHVPLALVGVADYRGEVVPVVDLRTRFGLSSAKPTRKTKWVIVDVAGRLVALVVDAVTEVFGTGGADLRPAPSLGGGDDERGIAGVAGRGGTMVFVLDTLRLRDLTDRLVPVVAIDAAKSTPSLPPRPST
jgi:purine-binding chemotaxis protein CheW